MLTLVKLYLNILIRIRIKKEFDLVSDPYCNAFGAETLTTCHKECNSFTMVKILRLAFSETWILFPDLKYSLQPLGGTNDKMRTWALLLPVLLYEARCLRDSRSAQQQQQQNMFNIVGDTDSYTGTRHKRSPDHLEQDSG